MKSGYTIALVLLAGILLTSAATWSNNQSFTGTYTFGAPNSNDDGRFAISGNNLIIDPAGPGVGNDENTVQHVTIVAAQ